MFCVIEYALLYLLNILLMLGMVPSVVPISLVPITTANKQSSPLDFLLLNLPAIDKIIKTLACHQS